MKPLAFLVAVLAAACGGSVPANQDKPDAHPPGPDASLCKMQVISPSYGALDGSKGTASITDSGVDLYHLGLSSDAKPDVLSIELYAGFGPFASGVAPATVDLSTQQSFSDCGACVLIYGDENPSCTASNNDCSAEYYMPLSGTLTLTSVDGRMTGMLQDAVFQHVLIDFNHTDVNGKHDYPTTSAMDDCGSSIQSVSFDKSYGSIGTADAGTAD